MVDLTAVTGQASKTCSRMRHANWASHEISAIAGRVPRRGSSVFLPRAKALLREAGQAAAQARAVAAPMVVTIGFTTGISNGDIQRPLCDEDGDLLNGVVAVPAAVPVRGFRLSMASPVGGASFDGGFTWREPCSQFPALPAVTVAGIA